MIFIAGVFVGFILAIGIGVWLEDRKKKNKLKEVENHFNSVLRSMDRGHIKFMNRINQTAVYQMLAGGLGQIELVHFLDKSDVAIFQNGKCLYTSDLVEKDTINEICMKLSHRFNKELNDVSTVMGNIIDNKTLNNINKNVRNFTGGDMNDIMGMGIPPKSEEPTFDLNEILDQISSQGIESLSKEQLAYLKEFGDE